MIISESHYTTEEQLSDLRAFMLHASEQLLSATDEELPDVRFMGSKQLRRYAIEQDMVVGQIFQKLESLIDKHRIREI